MKKESWDLIFAKLEAMSEDEVYQLALRSGVLFYEEKTLEEEFALEGVMPYENAVVSYQNGCYGQSGARINAQNFISAVQGTLGRFLKESNAEYFYCTPQWIYPSIDYSDQEYLEAA